MTVADSKVADMIKALGGLEDDLDSLDSKVADMKHQLIVKTQKEIDILYQKTRDAANAEAEAIITESREAANAEAARISQETESNLAEIRAGIDAGFDSAVDITVDTIINP